MNEAAFVIRSMTRSELDTVVEWAAAEGWNPGRSDADAFFAADPEAFLIGLIDDQPVASISVVKYGSDFGFLGLYIVVPAFRGRGYGIRIWQAGMARLQGRTVGLDGVVAQQSNYAKSGFALAYSHFRFSGRITASKVTDPQIAALTEIDFDTLCRYDRAAFPAERRGFLSLWISRPGTVALGFIEDGRLGGYGVIRPSREGFRIGPLFADTPAIAERLLRALQSQPEAGSAIYIDVPMTNAQAVALVSALGMQPAFETARMYAGADPKLPIERIFAVTSLELG